MKTTLSIFALLVMIPISTVWWLFFPFAIASIFLFKKIYPSLLAGFVLDAIYFDGRWPMLLGASLVFAALFILMEDKLRYHA